MKTIIVLILFMFSIMAMPHICLAHGVGGSITEKQAMLVTAEYDDGEPMSYAAVDIINSSEKIPFQSGRTDKNGKFLFLPDNPGEWQVVVDDEMGHRLALNISVNTNMAIDSESNQHAADSHNHSFSKSENALMGISIIFGVFGFLFWWKGRKINLEH